MRILVAGGAGFIGTNLVARYLLLGHRVTVIDNLCTGKKKNLDHLQQKYPHRLKFIIADITQKLPVFSQKFNVIANLACPASPPAYQKLALETLRVNSLGVENLLQLALKHQARFLQASTSEVYGDPLVHPQVESYKGNVNSYGDRSMYDEGKRYAEALIWTYRHKYHLNTGIIRIFNTYGPYMSPNDGRVVTNFLYQALNNQPLTVYGDGTQTRSFCFIDDQVDAWIKMTGSNQPGPINIGNPDEFTMLELIEVIEKILYKTCRVKYLPIGQDDPGKRRPDISKAKKLLHWQPKISLQEGLKRMLNAL